MAQKFYNESDIQAIASAIRAKNGLSSTYKVSQMASAIQNIPSGSGGGGNTDIEDGLITRTLSIYENSRVTSIGSYAFYYQMLLTSISFPQVTNINMNAFALCTTLTSANFPQVTTIGSSAFYRCYALTSISFPQVNSIGSNAFYQCNHLTSVNFSQVSYIGGSAFQNCSALTSADFPQASYIGNYAFYECNYLTSINFPQVISIGNYAFQWTPLTSVSFPQVTTIGISAFFSCRSLTSANFPQVTTIGSSAFNWCIALTSVKFGGEQSKSGQLNASCFASCYNLINLTLHGSYLYSLSNSKAFTSTPIAGYSASAGQYGSIYVPTDLYSEYISATNWAYFSSRIVSYVETGSSGLSD